MADNTGAEPAKKAPRKKPPPKRNNQGNRSQNEGGAGPSASSEGGGQHRRGGGGHGGRLPHQIHKIDFKKYEKMENDIKNNFSDIKMSNGAKDECTICWKSCDVFGIGSCRHPICIECALRIRVLGGQKNCPVCRTDTDILFLLFASNGLQTCPLNFGKHGHPAEDRFAIRFENAAVGERYEQYLSHVCKICKSPEGDRLEFPTYVSLRQHMANVHHLSYCAICTENLNLFSRERKTYTRDTLNRHIRCGDVDDKSQKGHPTCLFCDQRFFDNEAQYKHLRKDHFYCQFCEADGSMTNAFFNKHDQLVAHYKQKHFLCENEDCKRAGIAFATQLEFNLHKTQHSDKKTVHLDFQYNDREVVGRGRVRRDNAGPSLPRQHTGVAVVPQAPQPPPQPRPNTEIIVVPSAQTRLPIRYQRGPTFTPRVDDFPSLGGGPSSSGQSQTPQVVVPQEFPRLNKVGKATNPAHQPNKPKKPTTPQEHFPSLGGRPSSAQQAQAATNWAKHSERFEVIDDDERMVTVSRPPTQQQPVARPVVATAAPVQQKKAPAPKPAAPIPSEDFPALPAGSGFKGLGSTSNWANKTKGKSAITGVKMPKKKAPLPQPDIWPNRSVTTPASDYKPPEETWEEVPMKRKMTKKERKALEERMALSEAMQREEEERQFKEKMMEKPPADLELQRVLLDDIASSLGNSPMTSAESSSSSVSSKKKAEDSSAALKEKNVASQTKAVENAKKEQKKNKKEKAPEQSAANFPPLEATTPKKQQPEPESEPEAPASGLSSWLFNSMSNVLSGLSLSNVLGDTSQPLSSMATKVVAEKPMDSAPPGLSRASSVSTPNGVNHTISFDAPPGFENLVPNGPPPGLENSVPKQQSQLFTMAPFLSAQDTQKPVVAPVIPDSDGWTSTANNNNNNNKKNKGRAK